MAAPTGKRPQPMLVVVTGAPASGKTTLGRLLAVALCLPLLSLDRVKESLHDALGGAAPTRLELRLAAEAVVVGLLGDSATGAVLDIWLDPSRDDRDRLRGGLPPDLLVREIYCDAPAEVAVRRYSDRVRHGPHLPPDLEVLARIRAAVELMAEGSSSAPRGLGPVLRVDTSQEVVVPDLVRWLTAGSETVRRVEN